MSTASCLYTPSPTESVEQEKNDIQALEYMNTRRRGEIVNNAAPRTLTPEQEKKLWRKIDMRILPSLILMYLCSFMDRSAFICYFLPHSLPECHQATSVRCLCILIRTVSMTDRNYVRKREAARHGGTARPHGSQVQHCFGTSNDSECTQGLSGFL